MLRWECDGHGAETLSRFAETSRNRTDTQGGVLRVVGTDSDHSVDFLEKRTDVDWNMDLGTGEGRKTQKNIMRGIARSSGSEDHDGAKRSWRVGQSGGRIRSWTICRDRGTLSRTQGDDREQTSFAGVTRRTALGAFVCRYSLESHERCGISWTC